MLFFVINNPLGDRPEVRQTTASRRHQPVDHFYHPRHVFVSRRRLFHAPSSWLWTHDSTRSVTCGTESLLHGRPRTDQNIRVVPIEPGMSAG